MVVVVEVLVGLGGEGHRLGCLEGGGEEFTGCLEEEKVVVVGEERVEKAIDGDLASCANREKGFVHSKNAEMVSK